MESARAILKADWRQQAIACVSTTVDTEQMETEASGRAAFAACDDKVVSGFDCVERLEI